MVAEAHRRLGHTPLRELESLLAAFARLRDGQPPVALAELVGFVAGDLQVWQGRLMAGVEQAGRGSEAGCGDFT